MLDRAQVERVVANIERLTECKHVDDGFDPPCVSRDVLTALYRF